MTNRQTSSKVCYEFFFAVNLDLLAFFMSGASTVVARGPACAAPRKSDAQGAVVVTTLWIIAAIFACARTDPSPNGTGVLVSLTVQDVLILCTASWLLYKSLCARSIILAVPWIIVMMYSIYFTHYKSILKMVYAFKSSKIYAPLPWMTVCLSGIALFIRSILTFRVLQLSTYLWYRKRLEKELYQIME